MCYSWLAFAYSTVLYNFAMEHTRYGEPRQKIKNFEHGNFDITLLENADFFPCFVLQAYDYDNYTIGKIAINYRLLGYSFKCK